jgi:hypothetical protein
MEPHSPLTSGPARQRAWPLLAFASLSFIPVLGIFLGVAAICWGLVSDRPRALWGVALGATGLLLHVAGGVSVYEYNSRHNPVAMTQLNTTLAQRHAADARSDLAALVAGIEAYRAHYGAYPPSLPVLQQAALLALHPVNIVDQSAPRLIPRFYQYRLAPDGRSYDLFAVGPDGTPGTADDIRPVLADSLRRRSGYRPLR